jgi:hypothetical protein
LTKPVTLEDLTPYHRAKVIKRAADWRMKHHHRVLQLMLTNHGRSKPEAPPTGSIIFAPEKWEAHHWHWFRTIVTEQAASIMRKT